MAVGIFYGSNGGVTEGIAEEIKSALGVDADLNDIANAEVDDFAKYDKMIIGTSTWGEGDLQDDWDEFFEDFQEVDFSGKTVAFFGVGDQEGYPDNFVDGMGILHNQAVEKGATVVGGGWSTDGYEYDESISVTDGSFVGLVLDDDNQDDMTADRISTWVDSIKGDFS